eukprot:scaffold10343_cov71-Cylindrotheca_fusiformis.AAC.1
MPSWTTSNSRRFLSSQIEVATSDGMPRGRITRAGNSTSTPPMDNPKPSWGGKTGSSRHQLFLWNRVSTTGILSQELGFCESS